MKQLIIIGTGGFAREVSTLAKHCIGYGSQFVVKGFLSSDPHLLDHYDYYPPYLGDIPDYEIGDHDVFCIGIADPKAKERCFNLLQPHQPSYYNLVHRTADLTEGVKLGVGCIIGRNCIISNDTIIGDHVTMNSGVMIGHDCKIGSFVHLNAGCFLGGNVTVADQVTIHTMAMVIPKITIHKEATVGVGSVVIKNVDEKKTVFGNPAKNIN